MNNDIFNTLQIIDLSKVDNPSDFSYVGGIKNTWAMDASTISLFNNNPYDISLVEEMCENNKVKYDSNVILVSSEIKGYFAYRENLYNTIPKHIVKENGKYFDATLIPEFGNEHDSLAIRIDVHWEGNNVTVGFLPRESNNKLDMSQNIKGIFVPSIMTIIFPSPKDVEYLLLATDKVNASSKKTIKI